MDHFDPSTLSSPVLRVLFQRGFVEQTTDLAALDRALASGSVTFYIGYDPTASSLHAGSLVTIMAMRLLQQHGHKPIIVMGGSTAMVGDPSGKTEMRKLLSAEVIEANITAIRAQFSRFVHLDSGKPHDAIMLNNNDWLGPLGYIDFLRDIGVHFTVNRMITTKTYRDRLDQELPLSFLEFNYQLLQAYDFLHLFRNYGCTLQLGGSGQWGNIVAGVELIRRVNAGERGDVHCLTWPLLTTASGQKMGKTEKGAVWLDALLYSPFDYYQYWLRQDDRDVRKLLCLFTELPLEQIEELLSADIREAKKILAFEATRLLHGLDAAEQAKRASEQAFGDSDDWSAVNSVGTGELSMKLVDLVTEGTLAFKSKREARERIEAGAVRINGEVCTDPNRILDSNDHEKDGTLRLQAGKKYRVRVSFSHTSPPRSRTAD